MRRKNFAAHFFFIKKSVEKDNKGNYFKFKFNDGYDKYDTINWTVTEDLKTLSKNGGSSAKCYGVKVGDKVTITINIKTNEVSVVINGN